MGALQVGVVHQHGGGEVQGDVIGLLGQDLVDLDVNLVAALGVQRHTGLVQKRVDLRVVDTGDIEGAGGVEHIVIAAVGVGGLHGIAAAADVIIAVAEGGPPGAALHGLQLQVDAHIGKLGLQGLAQLGVVGGLAVEEGEGQTLCAGGGQQLLGLVGVVLIGGDVGGVALLTLHQGDVAHIAGALVHHDIDDLAVNGVGQGLTDLLADAVTVEVDEIEAVAHGAVGGQVLVLLGLQEGGGGQGGAEDHVGLAGLHGDEGGVHIGDEVEGDLLHGGGAVPVVLIGGQGDVLGGDPLHELEGAGAHGVAGELLLGDAVVVVGVDDGAVPQHVDEVAVGVLQVDGDGVVVHDVAAVHREGGELHPGLIAEALHGQLHIVGGEVVAVVELHALPQVEGVVQAVLRGLPVGGQHGHHLVVLVQGHQAVKDVGAEVDVRHGGQLLGVQGGEVGAQDDGQVLPGLAGGAGLSAGVGLGAGVLGLPTAAAGGQRQGHGQRQSKCEQSFHVCCFLLFSYISAMMSSAVRFLTLARRSSHHALS